MRHPILELCQFGHAFSLTLRFLRNASEQGLHSRARKSGLGLPCDLEYVPLPMISGIRDNGDPDVELVRWPFLMPEKFAPCLELQTMSLCRDNVFELGLAHATFPTKVQSVLDHGCLDDLVDLGENPSYWEHILQDYPDHPLVSDLEKRSISFGATLYGAPLRVWQQSTAACLATAMRLRRRSKGE